MGYHTKKIVELTEKINAARSKFPWVCNYSMLIAGNGIGQFSDISMVSYTIHSEKWSLTTPLNFRLLFVIWLFTGGKLTKL